MRKSIYLFLITVVVTVAMVIVSCGGADITGSVSASSVNTGGNANPGVDVPNLTNDNPSLPDDSPNLTNDNSNEPDDNPRNYYKIRVPFAIGGDGYTNVSYKDTNTLKQLWFDQINRKAVGDGKVFAIRNRSNNRDANNFQKKHTHGNYSAQDYYYFNENGDIVYKEDNTIIKKFMGAIITEYRDVNIKRGTTTIMGNNNNRKAINGWGGITWKQKGIYTVGAIYANTMTTEEVRKKYSWNVTSNAFKSGVFDFVTYWHLVETYHGGWFERNNVFERQYIEPGFIEVFVMYDYNNEGYNGAASVHSYYPYYGIYNYYKEYKNHPGFYFTPQNMLFMTNHNMYLGKRPEDTTLQLNHTAPFTDTYEHRGWCYLFMPGHAN